MTIFSGKSELTGTFFQNAADNIGSLVTQRDGFAQRILPVSEILFGCGLGKNRVVWIFQGSLCVAIQPFKMKHAEEFGLGIIDIILYKFIRLFVTVINGYLCTTIKNGSHFADLRKIDPDPFGDGKRDAIVITNCLPRYEIRYIRGRCCFSLDENYQNCFRTGSPGKGGGRKQCQPLVRGY